MNRVRMLIREFCEHNNEKYEVYEKKSGNNVCGENIHGIIVRSGFSYMQMLEELTSYLNDKNLVDEELEFAEGISVDEFESDTIVYFPVLDEIN